MSNGNGSNNGTNGSDTLVGVNGEDTIWGNGGEDLIFGDGSFDGGKGKKSKKKHKGKKAKKSKKGKEGHEEGNEEGYEGGYGGYGSPADPGNDLIFGGTGDDTIYGNDGDDTIDGGANDDLIFGDGFNGGSGSKAKGKKGKKAKKGKKGHEEDEEGNEGGSGSSPSYAPGDDSITGGTGDDTIYGNDGDDTIEGGAGDDLIFGDGISPNTSGGGAKGKKAKGKKSKKKKSNEEEENEEGNEGGGSSVIPGYSYKPGDDVLIGGQGDDTIVGGDGDDVIKGGAGEDLLYGDQMPGGDYGTDEATIGNDRFEFDEVGDGYGDTVIGGGPRDPGSRGNRDDDTLDLTGTTDDGIRIIIDKEVDNDGNGFDGTVTWVDEDGNELGTLEFENIENIIPCFVKGTHIETDRGQVPVEELQTGDLVRTADNGLKPITWIGARKVKGRGNYAPISIKAGALGAARDFQVSPLHRMLIGGAKSALYMGEEEVLVPAKFLVNGDTIFTAECDEVEYFHILFDQHEIIFAEGVETESFHPGLQGLGAFSEETREEILGLFPELRFKDATDVIGKPARPIARKFEAKLLS